MKTALIAIAAVIGIWFLFILGLKALAAGLRRSTARAARSVLEGEEILRITDNASYLGADFPGPNLPPRTSGVLALTQGRVLFLPWFPRRAVTLPVGTISRVALAQNFGDRSYNIPILILRIKGVRNPDGTMAWLLHDPEEWEREIGETVGERREKGER